MIINSNLKKPDKITVNSKETKDNTYQLYIDLVNTMNSYVKMIRKFDIEKAKDIYDSYDLLREREKIKIKIKKLRQINSNLALRLAIQLGIKKNLIDNYL